MIHQFKTTQSNLGFDFDVEFDKNQKIYCIIGKNGIGKTQLLENMAKSLFLIHSIFEFSIESIYKYNGLSSFIITSLNESSLFENNKLQLPFSLKINSQLINSYGVSDPKHWMYILFRDLDASKRDDIRIRCDKPIVFIGAKNRGFTKNLDTNNIKVLGDSATRFMNSINRTMKYINSEGLEDREVVNWFVSRVILNQELLSISKQTSNEVKVLLRLIEKLQPSLNLIFDDGSLNLKYEDGKLFMDNVPFDKLSTGFISVIKIFQEILESYSGWYAVSMNPFDENSENFDITQMDGIVFIDEIEPHLHLSWQTKIISILREFFPQTTFYISTHSPLVLAGLKEGEAYELYKDEEANIVKTKKIEKIENYFLNDIVSEFFGVDLNKERIENVDKEKQQKGKDALLQLMQNLEKN